MLRSSQSLSPPLLAIMLMAFPMAAHAGDIAFKLEPGAAIPLSAPQADIFGDGGTQSMKLLFGVTPWLDVGPAASFMILPASKALAESGITWSFGGGARLMRPHDGETWAGMSPWIDGDILLVQTGEIRRPGFDAGTGVSVPIDTDRRFWVGPFFRYQHVFQPEKVGFDNTDSRVFIAGVSFEVGKGLKRAAPVAEVLPAEIRTVTQEVYSCPDGDQDGIPDMVDRCPEVVGTTESWGCPDYQHIVIRPDKLELKDKIYFAWDEATLEEISFPVLDEVVQALKDNKGFKVQVEGHTDSTGGDAHNQSLSEERAEAVLDYLVAHGIAEDRLVSKGFSSSVPTSSNETVAGREDNRRVEFVVSFILIDKGSAE